MQGKTFTISPDTQCTHCERPLSAGKTPRVVGVIGRVGPYEEGGIFHEGCHNALMADIQTPRVVPRPTPSVLDTLGLGFLRGGR